MGKFWRAAKLRSALLTVATSVVMVAPAYAQQQAQTFNIPAQNTASALNEFARQAGVQILFPYDVARRSNSEALQGSFTRDEALRRLTAGTQLSVRSNDGRTIVLADVSSPTQLGAADAPSYADNEEEIVVTGTSIRGANLTSPVTSIDRDEIVASGAGSVSSLMETLPQNFAQSGLDAGFSSGVTEQGANGTSINLGGLGEGTTLVLINGRRLAPGFAGSAVDISGLPISAVDRVEVLSGGASAIYGSDAIGGVVNFILRRDFDGAETSVRVGNAEGGIDEYRASHIFGRSWQSGNFVLSGEYYSRDQLFSNQRDFSTSSLLGSLLPEEESASLFLSAEQELVPSVRVFGDVLLSRRETERNRAARGTAVNDQSALTVGIVSDFANTWSVEGSISYGRNRLDAVSYQIGAPDVIQNTIDSSSDFISGDVKADGPLFSIPGGDVMLAVGFGARAENYDAITDIPGFMTFTQDSSRRIESFFAEASIPLIGEDNALPLARRLVLSLAGRADHYNDVGTSTDPKVGVLWEPAERLVFRASYGTSFRAPRLVDFDTGFNSAIGFFAFDPLSSTGTSYLVDLAGVDPDTLTPETATSFTAGGEFSSSNRAFRASAYYYEHEYEDQVANPPSSDIMLLNPDAFGSLIIRNPTLAQVNDFIAAAQLGQGFFPFDENFNLITNFDPSTVVILADTRRRNLSEVHTSGVNVALAYNFQLEGSELDIGLSATHIITREQRVTETSAPFETVDTTFNPPDWRARVYGTWTAGPWTANVFVNYTDAYTDNRTSPSEEVSSYTTADLRLAYEFDPTVDGPFNGVIIALAAQNAFDSEPPGLRSIGPYDAGYDPANADPLGRVVSLELTKRW